MREERKRIQLAFEKEGKIYDGHFIESNPILDHLRASPEEPRIFFFSFFLFFVQATSFQRVSLFFLPHDRESEAA